MKRFVPTVLKIYLKKVLSKENKRLQATQAEKKRIKAIPRFTPESTNLLDYTLHFPDSISFLFMYSEIFENEIYQFKSSKNNPRIIDAGGNIGLGTIYLKKLFPNASITVFEPNSKILSTLQKNIDSFKLSDIDLVPKALWTDENGIRFMSEGSDGGRIDSEKTNEWVETTKLSHYLKEEVDFLKIDIEGAEIEVLKECSNELPNVKRLFIEYHSFANQPQQLSILTKILEDCGFRYYLTTPGLVSPKPFIKTKSYMGMDMQLNIFAIRKDVQLNKTCG